MTDLKKYDVIREKKTGELFAYIRTEEGVLSVLSTEFKRKWVIRDEYEFTGYNAGHHMKYGITLPEAMRRIKAELGGSGTVVSELPEYKMNDRKLERQLDEFARQSAIDRLLDEINKRKQSGESFDDIEEQLKRIDEATEQHAQ